MTFSFTIPGTPQQQGSKRHIGPRSIEANPNLAPWRADALHYLQQAMTAQLVTQFVGPVEVHARFYYGRPLSHYGTGRNASLLKRGAPGFKASAPDLDKLCRALGDALTLAGVVRDDALIVIWSATKEWDDRPYVQGSVREVTP